MSPRTTFVLTLVGVLAAGFPLLHLTAPRTQTPQPEAQAAVPQTERFLLELRFTGQPTSLVIRHEGEDIASLPAGAESPFEFELQLPTTANSCLEAEVEATWADGSSENVLTLTAEAPGLPPRSETQWTGSDGSFLHSIFTFRW